MTERLISDEYELRGGTFELWSDGHGNPNEYPNWWLATDNAATAARFGVPVSTVLVDTDFKPRLTEQEMRDIGETVLGHYTFD